MRLYDWKKNIDKVQLNEVKNALINGELVIFPTETVYGIGADAFNFNAIKRIYEAKGRPSDNPLIVHVSDRIMLNKCVSNVTKIEEKLINTFMPGPFTLILEKSNVVPNEVTANLSTVAIRMPSNKIAIELIKEFGSPIAAPSANISGKPSGTNIEDIQEELGEKVYALIDGGSTDIGLESTVVRVIDDVPVILRPGAVTREDILSLIGKVKVDEHVLNNVQKEEQVLSPGMKHKHYSPETKCVLLDIKKPEEKREIAQLLANRNVAILGLDSENTYFDKVEFVSMGESLEDFSKNIFSKLRKIDKFGYDVIFIETVQMDGIGLAIMNRIIRTCGYSVLNNKNQVKDYIENKR